MVVVLCLVKKLCDQGIIPLIHDIKEAKNRGEHLSVSDTQGLFMGQCVGLVDHVKPAQEIVDEMIRDAIATMERNNSTIISKL